MDPVQTSPFTAGASDKVLNDVQLLYSTQHYEQVILECEKIFSLDPLQKGNRQLLHMYNKSKGKVEELFLKKRFEQMRLRSKAFKRDTDQVQSIEEAMYWVRSFMKQNDYPKAIRGCKEILAIDPENNMAQALLGRAVALRKASESSLKQTVKKEKDARHEEDHKKLTKLEQYKLKMADAVEFQNFKQANKFAEKVLMIDSNDVEALTVQRQYRLSQDKDARIKSDMHQVDFSSLKKWKRQLELYRLKNKRRLTLFTKLVLSRLHENQDDRLKRKALALVQEQKEDNVLALKIQKNLIPQIDKYTLPGFDLWGDTLQSEQIGGDSFNFIQKDEENIVFYIGDASGHGIKASLFASRVNLIVRDCLKKGLSLRDTAITLNRKILEIKQKEKDFMTMILFNWNLKTKVLKFVGAGHEYIIHYKAAEQKIDMIPSKGIAIGMIENIEPLILERQIKVEDHDILVLYSDGVIEARLKENPDELFGIDRLNEQIIRNIQVKSARQMYEGILKELGATTKQDDDVTLLILRRDALSDLVFDEDLKGIEEIDLKTLKNLSRAEVERSIQEISLESKTKHLLLELKSLAQRGEYQLIINRCTSAIEQDRIYNKQVNVYLKKAKKRRVAEREAERKNTVAGIFSAAKEYYKAGEYLKAKMELLRILKMDEKNRNIRHLFKQVERRMLKYGNRRLKENTGELLLWWEKVTQHLEEKLNIVNKKDSLDFIVKLSNLVNSGIKVKESLLILLKQAKKESLKTMYNRMIQNLEEGFLLSFSMAVYPKVFSNLQVNLIRAGEESGNLGNILEDLSQQLLEERDLKRKIKGALIYPTFIVAFSVLLVIGMMVGVVPQLATAYKDAGLSLPGPTLVIITISDFIVHYWHIVLLVLFLVTVGITSYRKTLPGMLFFDRLQLKVPIINTLAIKQNIFLFGNSLAMLVDSGILLLDAMSITSDVVKNLYYKREVIRMRNDIINGKTLSSALGIEALTDKTKTQNRYFPLEVSQMVQVGETTGQVTKMLRGVATNYQNELKQFAKDFSTIIEPVLIVFIGVMVGILLIAIMLPFFQFGQVIQRQ